MKVSGALATSGHQAEFDACASAAARAGVPVRAVIEEVLAPRVQSGRSSEPEALLAEQPPSRNATGVPSRASFSASSFVLSPSYWQRTATRGACEARQRPDSSSRDAHRGRQMRTAEGGRCACRPERPRRFSSLAAQRVAALRPPWAKTVRSSREAASGAVLLPGTRGSLLVKHHERLYRLHAQLARDHRRFVHVDDDLPAAQLVRNGEQLRRYGLAGPAPPRKLHEHR